MSHSKHRITYSLTHTLYNRLHKLSRPNTLSYLAHLVVIKITQYFEYGSKDLFYKTSNAQNKFLITIRWRVCHGQSHPPQANIFSNLGTYPYRKESCKGLHFALLQPCLKLLAQGDVTESANYSLIFAARLGTYLWRVESYERVPLPYLCSRLD